MTEEFPVAKPCAAARMTVLSQNAHHCMEELALAAARLPDDPKALPCAHFEADTIHCTHGPLPHCELHAQITRLEERAHPARLGSSASRSPSPMKFRQPSNRTSTVTGTSSIHGADSISEAPSATRLPRLARGSCTPRPRKLRKLSNRIICGIRRVA